MTYDDEALADWMRTMKSHYQLVAQDRYPATYYYDGSRLDHVDYVEVYTFVPKAALSACERSAALAIGQTRR